MDDKTRVRGDQPQRRPAGAHPGEPPAGFDRDRMLLCMVLALCIAGASVDVIYTVLG